MAISDPHHLLLHGEARLLADNPLESYLHGLPNRPAIQPRRGRDSAGYLANWRIDADDVLRLTAISFRAEYQGPEEPYLGRLFPAATGAVEANWVCRRLLAYREQDLRFDPRGNRATYIQTTILAVWNGRLVAAEEWNRRTNTRMQAYASPTVGLFFGAEEAGFLRAIHARPEDDAPYLIYADWLEERQDPKAAIVRQGVDQRANPSYEFVESSLLQLRQFHVPLVWMALMGFSPWSDQFRLY